MNRSQPHPAPLSRRTTLAAIAGAALTGVAAAPASASTSAPGRRSIRFATFNASLNRGTEGALVTDLSTPDNAQAGNVAETIQRVDPDVLLIRLSPCRESPPPRHATVVACAGPRPAHGHGH
ncbi:hypothetical protein ACI2L1_13825, partial [Streptomyces sp. NPDC019531]